jgi:L-glutamine-phosphate cytidylyltransferase
MNDITKAIIIAAGMGSRLRPYTDELPKCLLPIGDSTIIGHALSVLRAEGLSGIAMIRGYCSDRLVPEGVTFFENTDYPNNNILHSLFYAEQFMDEGFVVSYSDILFKREVVRALLASDADISVVVDRDWRAIYQGRELHPISEAEVVQDSSDAILKIGKGIVSENEATGEFIGMAKFSVAGAGILRSEFARLRAKFGEQESLPFQRAAAFRKAYLTDMFQELVDRGIVVHVTAISGGWMEIDTPEDYERAQDFHA